MTRSSWTFRDVYAEHGLMVWRVLRRMGVRRADIEDVFQEVFLVVHRKLVEFKGRSTMRTWVCGIAMRCASDYRRRAHIQREAPLEASFDGRVDATQQTGIEQREAREALDRVLAGLDEDKRAVFVLFEVEGLSMSEIAETLGCPLKTAYSRLYAAREQVEAAILELSFQERAS